MQDRPNNNIDQAVKITLSRNLESYNFLLLLFTLTWNFLKLNRVVLFHDTRYTIQ